MGVSSEVVLEVAFIGEVWEGLGGDALSRLVSASKIVARRRILGKVVLALGRCIFCEGD